jgi:hypothetical protein
LNQFRTARIWEQEPKEAHANKRNKLSDVHFIALYTLRPPYTLGYSTWGQARLRGRRYWAIGNGRHFGSLANSCGE